MPEKLLTTEEACSILGIPPEKLAEFVEKGDLPAYKIGGKFLRFRRDQIEAIKKEIARDSGGTLSTEGAPKRRVRETYAVSGTTWDKLLDFLYFYDFYLISAVVIFCTLLFILKT
ncbi:MAG: helix-turn-helix domain-containing protein [Candidatus Omnitrophica bacterium]|nr:helix-turn-helix domain-containing protein [Candidatus Omnitrophota bacterium]